MDIFFGVRFWQVFIFLGVTENVWAEPPVRHILECTPWDLFSGENVHQKHKHSIKNGLETRQSQRTSVLFSTITWEAC